MGELASFDKFTSDGCRLAIMRPPKFLERIPEYREIVRRRRVTIAPPPSFNEIMRDMSSPYKSYWVYKKLEKEKERTSVSVYVQRPGHMIEPQSKMNNATVSYWLSSLGEGEFIKLNPFVGSV